MVPSKGAVMVVYSRLRLACSTWPLAFASSATVKSRFALESSSVATDTAAVLTSSCLRFKIGLRLQEQRLLLLLRGLRDLQRDLEVLLIDLEQQVALLDGGAVLVGDLVEEALHARDQIDAVERGRRARHLHVEGDFALLGLGYA